MDSRRQTELKLNLEDEQIQFERLECVEELGRPFEMQLDIIAPFREMDLLPHLGKMAAVKVSTDDVHERWFHGLVVEGEYRKQTPSGFHYRLTLRPWTWFLEQNREYAIYQDLDALEIIKKVLSDAGINDIEDENLRRKTLPKRDYCVQYGESHFDFISRLMEEEGIYYHFRHEEKRHVMLLCDSPSSHADSDPPTLNYNPMSVSLFNSTSAARHENPETDVTVWTQHVETRGQGKVTIRDYNFEKATTALEAVESEPDAHLKDKVEVYGYPGRFLDNSRGGVLAKIRLEALRAQRVRFRGETQATKLLVGTKVTVTDHPNDKLEGNFLITRTFHSVTAETYRTGESSEEKSFNVAFDAIPADTPWHTPQVTPKPIVHGLESAIVSGPTTDEIHTDEYGRVMVRFHWDRSGSENNKCTCWIRVSQTGGLGNIILPRVGHEVLVDFIAGDPDRPLVTGRVFNSNHKPVYKLPDHATRAVWRSQTYGARTATDYGAALGDVKQESANEIRFEDKVGEEEFFLHATKDMNTRVHNDETLKVGRDQAITIFRDRKLTVENNETVDVKKNRDTTIGVNDTLTVKNKLAITATASITLTCGGSKITMEPTGIKIEAPMIKLNATGQLEAQGTMTTVKAASLLTLQGAMVKIN